MVEQLCGYTGNWVVAPGESVDVYVSSTAATYRHRIVRLVQGFEHDKAPAVDYQVVADDNEQHDGRPQYANMGSYGLFDAELDAASLAMDIWVYPTMVDAEAAQTIFAAEDGVYGCALSLTKGSIAVSYGDGTRSAQVATGIVLPRWRWTKLSLRIADGAFNLDAHTAPRVVQQSPPDASASGPCAAVFKKLTQLVFGATRLGPVFGKHFNGKIDSPAIQSGGHTYKFDLSQYMTSNEFAETVTGRKGTFVNAPTRGVRGWNWDGSECDWTKADYGYGAVHFHEDDLEDAAWEKDFTVAVPESCRSGVYAVHIYADKESYDYITFFVRPRPQSRAKVAMVLPTFTYMAYANEHMYDQDRPSKMTVSGDLPIKKDHNFEKIESRLDLGLALYDVHKDGSGTTYSSYKRPILNARFGYVHWGLLRPRELSADLLMLNFLENELKVDYDVLTDHDLNEFGVEALENYSTVITGCHPEYHTHESYSAFRMFAEKGGNIMYLGGNGFYWAIACNPKNPHLIEVRRGDQGCRSFGLPGGERVHSIDGKQGGLWRSRGLAANYLFGVGCCAFGTGPGVSFRKLPVPKSLSWVWAGIEGEVFGEEGFGGGASGDEIDRYDALLGSPENATVLATSVGHPDDFALFNEDSMFPMINTLGSQTDRIRSDIVLYDTEFGGSVFSVGSINWYCSLGWNGYQNPVARLTRNILLQFMAR